MRIVLLGYGTVGGGVDLLAHGKHGMEVAKILCLGDQSALQGRGVQDITAITEDPTIDTVVEAMGGTHPAWEYASAALKAGKNFVTANKALVAAYLPQLLELSQAHGGALRCTAAVGGGIPWLVNLERCRRLDTVTRLWGIFNGTTNYILDAMTRQGADFAETLQKAQALGYAEADPSADIDGWDVRRKLVISIAAAFDAVLSEEEIPTLGIRSITAEDVENFAAMGRVCKLLARGKRTESGIFVAVEPVLLDARAPEAAVPENYNLVAYESENAGWQSYFGQGAGRYPTAYNVVQDCLDIAGGVKRFYAVSPAPGQNRDEACRWYIRGERDHWLDSIAASTVGRAVLTEPVSRQAVCAWAKEHPAAFAAVVEN